MSDLLKAIVLVQDVIAQATVAVIAFSSRISRIHQSWAGEFSSSAGWGVSHGRNQQRGADEWWNRERRVAVSLAVVFRASSPFVSLPIAP